MFNYPMPAAEMIGRLRRTLFIEPTPGRKKISGILLVLMLFLLAIQIPVKASHIMSLLSGTTIIDSIPILTLSQTAISCAGGTNGSVIATVSGGSAPYQYSKDKGATWQPVPQFERLGPGRYTIVVKDNKGQQASASITLTAPRPLAATAKPYPVTCFDAGNGSISVAASGGTPPYLYFLDNGPAWQREAKYYEVSAGSHTVYVKDQHDCMTKVITEITAPAKLTVRTKHDNVTCDNGKDGRITVTASGGTPPYQYSADNGKTWQHAPTFTHLPQGDHLIQVRDTSGCVAGTNVKIIAPLALTVSTQNTDISCYGGCNGRIVIQAQGGTSPYRYSSNQGLTWQQTPEFSGISAGVYQLAVKDSNGCMIRSSVKLSEPEGLSIASASATFDSATYCSLRMAVGGGGPSYAFSIDQGKSWQDSATFRRIRTGSYNVFARDRNGCIRVVTVTLAVAKPLELVVDSWGASCFGAANAGFTVKTAGGTSPYRYSIDNGVSWQAQNTFRVHAGVYNILVEDKAGKRASVKTQVGEPAALTASAQSRDVSCHNASNGIITAVASGGTPPYKYSINDGANWQSNASFEGLPGGSYILMIKDASGCGASLPVTVNEPSPLSSRTKSRSASCHDASDGSFTVTTTGGTPPYQYSLDKGRHWQDTTLFSRLAAGNHYLLIRDARGCTESTTVQVKAPQPVTFTAGSRHVSCYGGTDGSVTIAAQGGTMPYRYSMDNVHWQDTAWFNNLPAGRFTLYVQDANGCGKQAETGITEPTQLALAMEHWANGCSYAGGQIQVKAGGGTPPYLYTTADSSISNTDGAFKELSTGSYAIHVTDRNGCTDKLDPIAISVSPQLNLNITAKTDMQCDGIHKGSVTLTADGGIPPYRYTLNEKEVLSLNIPVLDNGAYEAVVKDQNGCIATRPFDIILLDDQCELTMPSGFSPNGDGRNDVFRPALYGNISQYQLQVFNAWGNLVFASNDPEDGWDGALNGRQQTGGTYVWMARYVDYKGTAKVKRGVVTMIR
jgi:gliding motility-associated-like protein